MAWIPVVPEHTLVPYHVCTRQDPWNEHKSRRACHPHAKPIGKLENAGSNKFFCPYCSTVFRVILVRQGSGVPKENR